MREKHTCHGPCDTVSDNCLSDHRSGHCIIPIDDDYNDERFPIRCIPAPRRVFTRDNPECDRSLPRPLFINFSQQLPPPTKLFQCDTCFKSFLNLDTLSSHIACSHLLPDYNCFRRSNTIKRKSFASCHLCGALFASKSLFNHHPCVSAPPEEASASLQNSSQPPLSYPNFSLGVDFPPTPNLPPSSYPNFSMGVTFPPTPVHAPTTAPRETLGQVNLDSQANDTETSAGVSNLPICTPQSVDETRVNSRNSQMSSSNRKTWPCDVPGCRIVKRSKKGLSIHKFREHKIPYPKRDIPSNTQPSQVDGNITPSQNQDRVTVDDPSNASTQQCPTHTSRSGNILHILFPLQCPTLCTEQNCIFDSKGKTWSSNKCSLLRHLRSAHHLSNLTSIHWCATCAQKIKKPKKHPCLAQGVMLKLPFDSEYKCQECDEKFTTDLGLRNHVSAHKKTTALCNSVQRVIPRMGTRKWKKKKTNSATTSSEPPDEAITDPTCVLAPPPTQSDSTQPPPPDDEQPPGPLSIYIDHLQDLLNQDPTEEFFQMFTETVEMAMTDIKNLSFQSASAFTDQSHGKSSVVDHPKADNPSGKKPEKREINIIDPQACQSLYNRNRKRCVREICSGPPTRCMIPVETVKDFYRSAWDSVPPPIPDLPITTEERTPLLENIISISE
ncbi:hypothetical protein AVEN_36763-1, partial [Araneus ventricosus]